jgi:hypothetical protein
VFKVDRAMDGSTPSHSKIRNAIDRDSNAIIAVFGYAMITSVRGYVDVKARCTYIP